MGEDDTIDTEPSDLNNCGMPNVGAGAPVSPLAPGLP